MHILNGELGPLKLKDRNEINDKFQGGPRALKNAIKKRNRTDVSYDFFF